jgi:hypothetical protein
MTRKLTVLFRRDPTKDRQTDKVDFEGYQILWPDERPVAIGIEAFCKHGQRLFGLGKYLAGCHEKLIKVLCMPLESRDDDLNRIPGHRVRRFYIQRTGDTGRIHFMDGTPTTMIFDVRRDEPRVLNWLGLPDLADGEIAWFDLAAVDATAPMPAIHHRPRRVVCEASV